MSALDLLRSLRLDSGERWGDVATDWQLDDARAVLEPEADDPRLHFLTRGRSGSKTVDLGAMVTVALIEQLPAAARAYWVASDRDQGRLGIDAIAGIVHRSGLAGVLKVDGWRVTAPNGASLEVLAADGPSAYGLRPHLIVADELAQWAESGRAVWVAVVSSVPKVKGCRLVVLTTAGDPAHFSAKVRDRAAASKRWRLHEVPGPVPWVSRDALLEQKALLTDSQYARLHLNRWTASEDRLVSADNLAAAVVLDGPQDYRPGTVYRMGMDLGLTHDRTAIAVAHAEPFGSARRVVLDRLVVFEGRKGHPVSLGEVEGTVVALWRSYGRPRLRADPFQAAGIVQNLRGRGVSVEEFAYTAGRYGQMASVLFALLRDGRLALYPDDGLVDELATVRLAETLPGQVRIQHDPGRHDDRCVALGMAVVPLVDRPSGRASVTSAVATPLPGGRPPPQVENPRVGRPFQRARVVRVGRFAVDADRYRPPRQEGFRE